MRGRSRFRKSCKQTKGEPSGKWILYFPPASATGRGQSEDALRHGQGKFEGKHPSILMDFKFRDLERRFCLQRHPRFDSSTLLSVGWLMIKVRWTTLGLLLRNWFEQIKQRCQNGKTRWEALRALKKTGRLKEINWKSMRVGTSLRTSFELGFGCHLA